MMRVNVLLTLLLLSLPQLTGATEPNVSGDGTIRAPYAGSEIVITTTSRLAGAIHSVKWNGQEFINSADHGRQLQSASNFDAGSKFSGETFNPTEAGSRFDGAGPKSTSRLLHMIARDNQLQTTSQMAFWLQPGERSSGNLAKNKTRLSNHLLTKRVTIGYGSHANVIQYDVTFGTPIGERHTFAQFEALTGYMLPVFSRFYVFKKESGEIAPLSDGPGEQRHPIVFATPSGKHVMAIYSPDQPSRGYETAGYGRWRFTPQKVVKWNCVFRIKDRDKGVTPGDYSFQCFVVIGNVDNVTATLRKLHATFATKSKP